MIEPADGLTVLVGPNNCGKSAFVSALQILCHNAKSNYVLRHGEKKCEIIVETDDDHVIQWSRTKSGSPKYVIDDQEFDRLKRGVPDELHQILHLGKVACEKDQFDVHFGEQKSPIFLLNESGKASAQFFASSSDAIRLVEMQDRHKGKVREAKQEQSRLRASKLQLTESLAQLKPVDEVSMRLSHCEQQYDEIRAADDAIEQTTIVIRALDEVQNKLAKQEATTKCLGGLLPPPELSNTESLERMIEDLEQTDVRFRRLSKSLETLSKLEPPPQLLETRPLGKLIEDRSTFNRNYERLVALGQALSKLNSPPEMEDESRLLELSRKMQLAIQQFSVHSKLSAVLGRLKPAPDQTDQTPLESIMNDMIRTNKNVVRADADLRTLEQQAESVTRELESWVRKNPECPTCGGKMTVDKLIGSGEHADG